MKKKLVQINVVCNGSTGRIMNQIQEKAIENGYEAYSFFGRGNPANENCKKIDTKIEIWWHVLISRLFGMQGHGSVFATYRMIKKIEKINPDIIHLHNIHGYYINYKILFNFLKKQNIPVIWTLHDCWAFTGHCTYYTENNNCDKWKTYCKDCQYKYVYPKIYFRKNRITKEYELKKEIINSINKLTLTVPSNWLKTEVKKSFLKNKQVCVIHNFIDVSIFRPMDYYDDIKEKYGIPKNKKIILGVAAQWSQSKGIEYFKKLSKIINNEKEIIVMVGLKENEIKKMPNNIIGIKRTDNLDELVKIYSMANVFFNPSIQETFSMVTLEALACGTACIVMNSTATPELIQNKECGIIEQNFNIEKIYQDIQKIYEISSKEECIKFAQNYDIKNIQDYIKLYNKRIEEQN